MVEPVAKREAVAHLQATMDPSERRACSIADANRNMVCNRPCWLLEMELRSRLRELANRRRLFDFRRL